MGSLDDKLSDILDDWYPGAQYKDVVPKIKQAFQDEGYLTPEQAMNVQELVNQMAETATKAFNMPTVQYVVMSDDQRIATPVCTGQEWYDRFEKEIRYVGNADFNRSTLEAAKKASGLVGEEE